MRRGWGIFSSKAVDKVSNSMSSRLHTQILYMLLLLIMMTDISCGSINRQTLIHIVGKKKTLIDFEYSVNSEMWGKREKGKGVEGREDLLFI